MSKSITQKKRLEQPRITLPPASQVIFLSKIKPHICMLSSSYIHYSDQISKNFRVKLQYCKKLVFTEMPPELDDQSAKQLPSIYKRMKYLRGIDVTSLMMGSSDKLYKIMRRLSSVKIRIETGLFWDRYRHTSKIFGHLSRLSLTTFKVKIACDLGNTNKRLNLILKGLIQGVKYMGNLKSFGLKIQNSSKISGIYDNKNQSRPLLPSEQILRKSILSHFSKLKKIEKLSLVFFGPPTSALGGFTERFHHLSSLKTIKIASGNQAQGTKLIQKLTGMTSLKSATLYQYFEPNNIISLAIKTPSLKILRIKENWFFNSRQMSALKQARAKQIGVVKLHLDLNINIGAKQESEFIANFIKAFSKVKSLRLFIQCDVENLKPNQVAKQINKLVQLQNLEIGLNMKSGAALSQFFFLINDLVQLKTLSLLLKTSSQKGWDPDMQEIYPALRGFLLQSKLLKEVTLNWDTFSPQCAETLRPIINEITDLDLFQLSYRPVFLQHEKAHDKILNVFEKTFKKTTAKFKNINLVSSCTPVNHKDCRSKMNKVEKVATKNPNIHKFSAFIGRSSIYLSHDFF